MTDYQPATSRPWRPASCSWCGEASFDPGFLQDSGEGSQGALRWVTGALERSFFGGAKSFGRERRDVQGARCSACGHLELFVR